jgi:hypothetical protein
MEETPLAKAVTMADVALRISTTTTTCFSFLKRLYW